MTPFQFRHTVKSIYPHVTVSIRTISFQDLARTSRKCLTVNGDRTNTELWTINQLAKTAGMAFPVCQANAKLLDTEKSRWLTTGSLALATCRHCKRVWPKRYPWTINHN